MIARDALTVWAAALLGLVGFLVFCGWTPLLPSNIAWLDWGDRAMHQLGWMAYRDSPWGLPPGSSPNLGLEISNSIALVDGLPLFAIPFKLIEQWLPRPFQYWGYWLLLCFVLQAVFGALLARSLGATRLTALVAAAFALATPAFLFRVPMHMALSGHWVVIAGLWLYAKEPAPKRWAWPILVGLAASIHATLLAMVLALWAASLLQRVLTRGLTRLGALFEFACVLVVLVAAFWVVGFLLPTDFGRDGYGDYKFNLLALFNPYDWSRIIPELPHLEYDYEGLSFLGVGVFALLLVAVASGAVLRLRAAAHPRWWPLVAALLLMLAFAASQKIAFGNQELFTIPYPKIVHIIGEVFRSTGRFVWPLVYLVTIGTIALLAMRLRPMPATVLATLALAVQLYDSSDRAMKFSASLPAPTTEWRTPLVSEFWDRAAAAGYQRLRGMPPKHRFQDWKILSYYAVTHGMATDTVHLARISRDALNGLIELAEEAVETGSFEPDTLYIVDSRAVSLVARWLTPDDLLAVVDDRIVFARGGAGLVEGLGIPPQALAND